MKPCYKVVQDIPEDIPHIVKVEATDLEGVSWRDAKKTLRGWFLDKAHALREVSEKDYFKSPLL